jgi:metacaspase-1
MPSTIKVLCLHGLGDHRGLDWGGAWAEAMKPALSGQQEVTFEFHFSTYDPIFEQTEISFGETMSAIWKLSRSGAANAFRRQRGVLSNISDRVRWTAGYVVAWVEDRKFQARTRAHLLAEIAAFQPDVILAHSLGSLISYNALSHEDARADEVAALLARVNYVTLGSQIGNPFVLGNLTSGRVQPLAVRHWHHLFNKHDDVFTAPLNVQGRSNFTQLLTPFDLEGAGDHAGQAYLGHTVTHESLWRPLVRARLGEAGAQARRGTRGRKTEAAAQPRQDLWRREPEAARRTRRRALLVGIDDYPNEADRLYGCVNDVFSMSAALQDCGFEPDEIRVCLNDRATAEGILSRLEWLVDGTADGDQLVFYYSGHGARVPEYGDFGEADRLTETLVPFDFDWSPARSVSDDQLYELYAQLPYGAQMLMIFDCCHSGSMHRQSAARARGINPPDDIRHRQLRWDRKEQMWVERAFEEINAGFTKNESDRSAYFGANGATVRIGRAAPLRTENRKDYDKAKQAQGGPVGPFLPLIIEACAEEQLSYEYRHGVTSYGAFTFCLTSILRQEKGLTFRRLVDLARERLARLGYEQTPQILGPSSYIDAPVPFATGRGGGRPAETLPGSATPRTSG